MSVTIAELSVGVHARTAPARAELQSFSKELQAGSLAGAELGSSVEGGADTASKSIEDLGKKTEETTKKSGGLGKIIQDLGGVFGMVGLPVGDAASKMGKASTTMQDIANTVPGLSAVLPLLSNPFVDVGLAAAAAAAVSVDFGIKYQGLTNQIAASEGISATAASKITAAFTNTAGSTTFSASEIAGAFSGVAGQIKTIAGRAPNASQTLDFMRSAMDAAEASGGNLAGTTKAITSTIQSFGLKINQSPLVANVLYSAANATGQSVATLGTSLARVHGRLGAMSPPLGQLGGLLVDMTAHGITGRMAMGALGTTFTTFLKPLQQHVASQQALKIAMGNLPPSLQAVAKEYATGNGKASDFTNVTKNLTLAQQKSWGAFTSAAKATWGANSALQKMGFSAVDAHGKLLPMDKIIGLVHEKIKGMSPAMAAATLSSMGFGQGASKIVGVMQAGAGVFDKYQKQVTAQNAAHEAAKKATQGLDAQFKIVRATIEDGLIKAGTALIPILEKVATVFLKVVLVAIKTVIDIVRNLVDYFMDIIHFVEDIFKGHWSSAWRDISDIPKRFIKILIDIFTDVPKMILALLQDLPKKVGKFFEDIGRWMKNAISDAIVAVVQFFVNLPRKIENAVGDLVTAAFGVLKGAAKWIETNAIKPVVDWFIKLPDRLVKALGDLVTTLWTALIKSADWIDSHVFHPIINYFKALPQRFVDGLGNIVDFVWHALINSGEWIDKNVLKPVVNYFKDLPGRIVSGLGNIVSFIWNGLTNSAQWIYDNVIQPVLNWFIALPGLITGALKDAATWLLDTGSNIVAGLVKGISNAWHTVWEFIKSKLSGLVNNVLSFFGINSPSKVFSDIGSSLMEGLTKGIQDNAHHPLNAIMAVAKTIGSQPMSATVSLTGLNGSNAIGAPTSVPGGSSGVLGASGGTSNVDQSQTNYSMNIYPQTMDESAMQAHFARMEMLNGIAA